MKKVATPQREAASQNQSNNNKINLKSIDAEILKRLNKAMPHLTKIRNRLLLHLFHGKPNTTGCICHDCDIGNLSDMVNKTNPILAKYGLAIINYRPEKPLTNSFGEPTQVHRWKLVSLEVE